MPSIREIAGEKLGEGVVNRIERAILNGHNTLAFVSLSLIALMNDFSDYIIVGSIPIVGDLVDIATGVIFTAIIWNIDPKIKWEVRGVTWALTALELIPGGDIVPSYMLATLFAWRKIKQQAEKGQLAVDQAREGDIDPELIEEFSNEQ